MIALNITPGAGTGLYGPVDHVIYHLNVVAVKSQPPVLDQDNVLGYAGENGSIGWSCVK